MRPHIFCLSLLAVALGASASISPALGQGDTGQVTIVVTDAVTQKPLDYARVLLDGPIITSEFSGRDGKVVFDDVPSGIYKTSVAKGGYQINDSRPFEVVPGRPVTIAVSLAKQQDVRTLGTVIVRPSPVVATSEISEKSPLRKLSPTLTGALGRLPGVTVSGGENGEPETVSLDGRDPTQTAVMLDGIMLTAPGQAANLGLIDSDLFSGAFVSRDPLPSALGGSVNFRTLEPTLSWRGRMSTSVGTFGEAATVLSEQGSIGWLGLALVHAVRGSESPLDGMTYLDASGFDYLHGGAQQSKGDLLKLRASLSENQTLTATLLDSNNYDDLICAQLTGRVPCGYGPGNWSGGHFAFASASDTALIAGLVPVQFVVYGADGRFDYDLLHRFVDRVPAPFGGFASGRLRGANFFIEVPSRGRHTLTFHATAVHDDASVTPFVASAGPYAGGSVTSGFGYVALSDAVQSNDTLSLTGRAGLSAVTHAGASVLGGVNAAWTPRSADQFSASFDFGGAAPGPPPQHVLTDPAALRFDCNADEAFGEGPGDGPARSWFTSARLGWQQRFAAGQMSATLYRQEESNVVIDALVNAQALPPDYFPAGYFDQAQAIFQSSAGCGAPHPFGPSNLYLTLPVGGTRRVYEGMQLTVATAIGSSTVGQVYFNVQGAKLLSGESRLQDPLSPTIPGAQLPNVPLHVAGVTVDRKAPRSAFELLFDARYVSANNGQNLPPYVTFSAAMQVASTRGGLTMAVDNVFNTHAGLFATAAGAVPLATVGGSPVPTVAHPLAPRRVTFTYNVSLGPGSVQTAPLGPQLASGASNAGLFVPLPHDPPNRPLDAAKTRPQCTPDGYALVKPVLDGLKAYVATIEDAKGGAGYPKLAPPAVPDVPSLAVAYHQVGESYALLLTPTDIEFLRGLVGCAVLHVTTPDEVEQRGLYLPPPTVFNRFALAFAPAAGLYVVQYPLQPGQAEFVLRPLPTTPPLLPFAPAPGPGCTDDFRPVATKLLGTLEKFVSAFDPLRPPPAQPEGWRVIAHNAPHGWWLELEMKDGSAFPALINCASIHVGTAREVKAAGFDGVRTPAFNFAPALGLYVIRPQ